MKKILLTSLIALAVGSVQAQTDLADERGGKRGMQHRGDPVAHLTKKLNLNDDQAIEVATIFEESRALHREIQESVQDEHCAVRANTHSQLAGVLTDEQLAQFTQMQQERKNRGRRPGRPDFANCET